MKIHQIHSLFEIDRSNEKVKESSQYKKVKLAYPFSEGVGKQTGHANVGKSTNCIHSPSNKK